MVETRSYVLEGINAYCQNGSLKSVEKECGVSEIIVSIDGSGRVDSRGPGMRESD